MYSLLATALFTAGYLFHTSQEDVIDRINKFNHRHREIHNLTSNASSSSNKPLQLTALSDKNFAEIPLDDASVPDVVMGRIDQLATHIVEDFIE